MLKDVCGLFRLTEERAEELFKMFSNSDGNFDDMVVFEIEMADIDHMEKMFLSFVMGVVATLDIQDRVVSVTSPKKTYIH